MSNELSDRERAIQLRLAGEAVEDICQRLTVYVAGKIFKRWPYKLSRH